MFFKYTFPFDMMFNTVFHSIGVINSVFVIDYGTNLVDGFSEESLRIPEVNLLSTYRYIFFTNWNIVSTNFLLKITFYFFIY